MKNKKQIIGILAGMGPKSTSPFLDLVIEQCQKQYGARNDIDFPHIIIYSLPTPFYVNQKINDRDMKVAICKGLQKLESTGVGFIAMPCNIAHKYFDNLRTCIKIPLLNIIDSTIKKLPKTAKKVTLFATSATIEAKIYQNIIQKQNIKLILNGEWQKEISSLVQSVKNGDSQNKLLSITKRLSKYLKKEKVDTIIIACTDITKIVKTMKGFTIIDSSEALAEETVKKYLDYSA
ncbi:MAG: amino acid racemase [Candidatus Gracilibacteria bacterium]|jgi:aspartate racemase